MVGINEAWQNERDKQNKRDVLLAAFNCGWGRKVRLYREYLDIDNSIYALADLVHVRPVYQRIIGVTSARLMLRFGTRDVVLRGIADVDMLRKAIVYLSTWCSVDVTSRPQKSVSERLKAQLECESLADVPVPLQLQSGERAHYACEATLCKEQSIGIARDHGMLIVTNQRAIYLGRMGQRVIDYAHITHTSCLRSGLVLARDDCSQRDIFEVEHPLETALHLETILRSWHSLGTVSAKRIVMPDSQEMIYHTPSTSPTPTPTPTHPHWTYASIPVPVPVPQQRRTALTIDEIDTIPLSASVSLWQTEEQV